MEDLLKVFRAGHHEFENGRFDKIDRKDPYHLFEEWMKEAVDRGEKEANAFMLATSNFEGQPIARIVYLKDVLDGQFVFYTNYNSDKGKDIASNSKVGMSFFWPDLSRQIRIEGECTKVPKEISDTYFASRPKGSQIGAWASNQSDALMSRDELEARFKEFEERFPNEVPRPEHWGGYQIRPTYFEFWQGRPSRLHDRVVFEPSGNNWDWRLLNP